jgi:hypothetical protein
MTSLRRLAFLTGATLLAAAALPVGCNPSSNEPPVTGQADSSSEGAVDVTNGHDRHVRDVTNVDAFPDSTPIPDSTAKDTLSGDVTDAESMDAATNCSSPVQNGSETDVGCGGPVCPACVVGKHCKTKSDCATPAVCDLSDGGGAEGVCNLASCHDGMMDGNETGVDCGGPTCAPCATGQGCLVATDCVSRVCTGMVCQAPTCTDGVKNGNETDIDCGGGTCPVCFVGKECISPTDCTSNICTGNTCSCPVSMVIVPTNLPLGGDYCVDALEVTYAEYNTFWISNPSLASQPSFCSWNSTFTPANGWPPDLVTTDPGYNGGFPVNWVNWCQAYGYCAQQGKRLCGDISGGSNLIANATNPDDSEWYNACSANGVNTYPYGSTYVAMRCNDSAEGLSGPWAELNSAGMLVNDMCQGGAAGLYQMSGNVAEWEDSCDGSTGAGDNCLLRGGSFTSVASGLTCATAVQKPRTYQGADSGFRCCL